MISALAAIPTAIASAHPALAHVAATYAHPGGPGWGGWGGPGWGGPGPGFFILAPIFWFIVIAVVISLVARARWRRFGARGGFGPWGGPHGPGWGGQGGPWGGAWGASAQHDGTRAAEATLAERFAQGDIDEIEYRARLEVLRANRAAGPNTPS